MSDDNLSDQDEFFSEEDTSGNSEVIRLLKSMHSMLSELAKKKKKPEDDPYKYPKSKMEFENLKKEKEELATKLEEYQKKEKEEKVTELLDSFEQQGLIDSDKRQEMFKKYTENFSAEQIQTLIDNNASLDFGKAKKKSFKSKSCLTKNLKIFRNERKNSKTRLRT